jgi:glycosyltransferase involved in cell wall biosynthesis
MALAFIDAGADVYLDPIAVQAPLPPAIAQLLTKRLTPPFDLLIRHWDPEHLEISEGARLNAAVTVAWSMWEFTSLDNCGRRSSLKKRLKNFDLVVGYDTVTSAGLAKYVTTRAATVQGGFWPDRWPPRPRNWNGPLNFCMVGALGPRKDPFLAIDAFKEVREEHPDFDMRLNLKTNLPGLHSKMQDWVPGLRVFYEVWPEDMMREFYYNQHVLLAPSRGEGKNLPALEMLATGGTVIGTNWGGHTQWLSPAIGYPLNYTLEPVKATLPDCLWAKADKDHLKQLMVHAYENRDELQRKATTAAALIPAMCSWPKVIERLMDAIADLGDAGQRVNHAYRRAQAFAQDRRQLVNL